jgi:CBS domain-containing protein
MPTVREYMDDDPATVTPDTSAEDVARLLGTHELHGVPVVNEAGRCVGMVTENDLVMADEEGDLHIPHYIELFGGLVFLESVRGFERRLKKAVAATARDMMTADPTTIGPDEDVHAAAKVISESGHNRLPVVEHGRLVGVITRADVLRALTESE